MILFVSELKAAARYFGFIGLWVGCVLVCGAGTNSSQNQTTTTAARIRGRITEISGRPAPGIKMVLCTYRDKENYDSDFMYTGGETKTNKDGQYEFKVNVNHYGYRVATGGETVTGARSSKFILKPGEIHNVENLNVRLATSSLSGELRDKEGNALAGLIYGAKQNGFTPADIYLPIRINKTLKENPNNKYIYKTPLPITGPHGEFNLPSALPDEEIALSVIMPDKNVFTWRNIAPGQKDLKLSVAQAEQEDLPPGWMDGGGYSIGDSKPRIVNKIGFNLFDLEGRKVSLDDERFKNKVLIINIWGTWCEVCRREIPCLIGLQDKYRSQGLEIIGIAFENEPDLEKQRTQVGEFARNHKINYTILLGGIAHASDVESAIQGLNNFERYPTNLFIDRKKTVRKIGIGFYCDTPELAGWSTRNMDDAINKLMSGN